MIQAANRDGSRLLVLTATLGNSPWMRECLASIEAHAGGDYLHLMAVPVERRAVMQARHPGVTIVTDAGRSGGLYGALNAALAVADTLAWDWMTYLADDDVLRPGFAAVRAKAARATRPGEAAVWRGEVEMIDSRDRPMCRVPYVRRPRDIAALVLAGMSPFMQQSLLFSREAVRRAGPFPIDFQICGDASHWLSALEHGAAFHHVPVVAAAFRVRSGQLSAAIRKHRYEFARLRTRAARLHGRKPTWPAVLRFRVSNLALYAERLRRVGWVSGLGLLRRS